MEQSAESPLAKILIVDDNEANRLLAQGTLEDEGYQVLLATDGPEAIAAFEASPPDCILLDVRMPGMDGFAVCERIRALPHGAETPIVFLTALRDVDTFDKALRAGGDDFLTKPVRPTEIVVRVQAALKLRRLRTELRDHYSLLKKQRDDLMRLQLQKERLTAFVVHDLKNPVSTMDLLAQLLLRDRALSPSAQESAAQIRTEARHLNRMILNLLDLSKADEGKLQPRLAQVALQPLVDEVLAEIEVYAQVHRVRLQSSLSVEHARADEDLLRRLLANLVENAVRHAPAESVVTVSAAAAPGGGAELRVADTGKGVPAELRERIFAPFVQIEGSAQNAATRAGRGLGLTFCRLAAEAHGGRIWIEDGAPGSIFCVRLPDER
jgi:signal transduction histidine kinase